MYTTEEILRTDLSEVVLRMAELGIRDFESFDFLSPPGQDGIRAAVETLRLLDALDEERRAHRDGAHDVPLPHPAQARADDRGGHPRVPLRDRGGHHRRHLPLRELPLPPARGRGAGGPPGPPHLPRPAGGLRLLPEDLRGLRALGKQGPVLRRRTTSTCGP